MPPVRDLSGALLLLAGFGALVALLEWRARRGGAPETSRSVISLVGGLGALTWPWVMASPIVALGLGGLMATLLDAGRRRGQLSCLAPGPRGARGLVLAPAIWGLMFLLCREQPWLFVVTILVATLGDAAATLADARYGRARFEVEDDDKSVEGSATFLVVAFLSIQLPLVLWTDPGLPPVSHRVLGACLTALLVTGFEAVSLGGRNAVWVPLGTFGVLTRVLAQPLDELVFQTLSLVLFALGSVVMVRRTGAFNVGGAVTMLLWVFGCWSLGSPDWAVPVAAGLLAYLGVRRALPDPDPVKVRAVVRTVLPVFVALAVGNLGLHVGRPGWYADMYAPFLVGCALVLQQVVRNRVAAARSGASGVAALGAFPLALVAGLASAVVFGSAWLVAPRAEAGVLGTGVVVTLGVAAAEEVWRRRSAAGITREEERVPRWTVTVAGIALTWLVLTWGLGAAWAPR